MATSIDICDRGDPGQRADPPRRKLRRRLHAARRSWSSTPRSTSTAEADTDLDPVSYEVLRSKLWNVNWDHQETIRRVSGSQVVVYGYDFNTTIQTEDGAGVCFGPGNLFFGGCADLVVKWTLEHRSMNVGINEGDIFLQDDPWIGTNHQMDAAVYAPVFWEGKLFAWVYNVIHQRELGGVEPGGFTQQAHDVYAEPTFFPPMKLVDAGKVREDVVDAWVRRSRLAGLMTLELRSQIAGVELARARVLELVERYGAARVKGTMRKMIDTTAGVVGERLERLPDGEWSDTRYVSGAVVGDLNPYRYALTVKKEGDRLTYSNAGTDPSVGSFNITAGVLRACITNSLLTFLCYDQYLCAAGLLEQVDFEFERGHDHRRPPPGRGLDLAGAGGGAGPGPVPEREDALDPRRDRPPHLRRLRLRDADLQPHLRHRPVRHADRELPARRDRRRARRLPLARRARPRRHDELDDEPGRQRRVDGTRGADALPLPPRGLRLRRPRALARRRLHRLGDGRPPLAGTLHLLRRPRPERHPGGRPARRLAGDRRRDVAGRGLRHPRLAGERQASPGPRRSCGRWRPRATWRRRRSSTTGCSSPTSSR